MWNWGMSIPCNESAEGKKSLLRKGQVQDFSLHFKQGLRVKSCLLELWNLCKQVYKQVLAQLAKAFS